MNKKENHERKPKMSAETAVSNLIDVQKENSPKTRPT